jgi:hypothetical protein
LGERLSNYYSSTSLLTIVLGRSPDKTAFTFEQHSLIIAVLVSVLALPMCGKAVTFGSFNSL